MPWQTAMAVDSYRPDGEDRAAVFSTSYGALAVVADGVGGRSGGAAAADGVVEAVRRLSEENGGTFDPRPWFVELDRQMSMTPGVGESTAVVTALSERAAIVNGVGDSVAWVVENGRQFDLMEGSPIRPAAKPWLGSGSANPPLGFLMKPSAGVLLLATDGLVKYTSAESIAWTVRSMPFEETPRALIELVRYPPGRLPDDVAVIVARWVDG